MSRNPLIPVTRKSFAQVAPQHQSLGSPSYTRVPVPGGDTNIQYVGNRGRFSVNDHRITRATPRHAPTKE